MELTKELKARFFAQYWGQNIVTMPYNKELTNAFEALYYWTLEDGSDNFYLNLKPLSSISDEDARQVMKLQQVGINFSEHNFYATDSALSFRYKYNGEWRRYDMEYEAMYWDSYQYLQSKCYALPFMGISVKEMIGAGWIKL